MKKVSKNGNQSRKCNKKSILFQIDRQTNIHGSGHIHHQHPSILKEDINIAAVNFAIDRKNKQQKSCQLKQPL